jgi:hypothetical protein
VRVPEEGGADHATADAVDARAGPRLGPVLLAEGALELCVERLLLGELVLDRLQVVDGPVARAVGRAVVAVGRRILVQREPVDVEIDGLREGHDM